VLAVAVLFAIVIGGRLHTYHGNATGFALFGAQFALYTHPPLNAEINSVYGYDGQFFYLLARDPLLLHASTLADFRHLTGEAFRMQRVAYPALAFIAAGGDRSALPWTMLVVNLIVVLAATAGFALLARRYGWSPWWALAVGLLAGFLTGTLRDLSDPVAVASMVGGLLMWQRRRRWWAAAFLSVAVLAREPMALAVVAVAIDELVQWWRHRGEPGAVRTAVREAWPAVVVPALAYVGWQAYIGARYGTVVASSGQAYLPPFVGVVDEVGHALDDPHVLNRIWDLIYIALMVVGIGAAIAMVARGASTAAAIAALLFGLSLLVLVFGDPWSYTRLSAPMFAALLVAGLQRRNPPALVVCAAAATLTVLVPFAPWLGAG
jgi:hypothetical protein